MHDPLVSPSPLIGVVRFLLVPFLAAVPLFPPHSCFVLRCGDSVDMGFFHPPLLQALLKERVLLLGECPPFLLFFRGSPPSLS